MITSLALMTSTASLASENKKTACTLHTEWFPGLRNLSGLNDLNNLSYLNDPFSLISSKNNWARLIHQPWHQNYLFWSDNVGLDHEKLIIFLIFDTLYLKAVEDRVISHKSNSPYSGFPTHHHTKSNMYISIRQIQIHCIKWETL